MDEGLRDVVVLVLVLGANVPYAQSAMVARKTDEGS